MATKTKKPVAGSVASTVTISPPMQATAYVTILGQSPLVMHKFSQRVIDAEEAKRMGITPKTTVREKLDPERDFIEATHFLPGFSPKDKPKKGVRYGFPANGIKKAMVAACREIDGLNMTEAKQLFFVSGTNEGIREYVEVFGTPRRRRDEVRLPNKSMDIRYRPEFVSWEAKLRIRFNAERMDLNTVINLLARAGQSVGIGDKRPSTEGSEFGQWTIGSITEPDKQSAKARR